jgi:hypothetical protein
MAHRLSEASDDDVLVYSAPDLDSYHPEISSSPSLQSLADRTPPSRRGRARASSFAYKRSPGRPSTTLDLEEDEIDQLGLEMDTLNRDAAAGVRPF